MMMTEDVKRILIGLLADMETAKDVQECRHILKDKILEL